MQSLSEVAVIDRQKYIKELTKLLSGMAPADREAVLRGVKIGRASCRERVCLYV